MISDINQGLSAQTDNQGSATIRVSTVVASQYSIVTATLQTDGNPNWSMFVGNQLRSIGVGPRVELGPRVVQPGESVRIEITGAALNASVTGSLHGTRGDTVSEILGAGYTPTPNVIGTQIQSQRVALYPDGTASSLKGPAPTFPSFTVGASGSSTQTFTLLPTQTNIRVEVVGSTQFRFQIAGHQTGEGYIGSVLVNGSSNFASANSPFRPIDVRIEPTWDRQVDITVSDQSAIASNVYVSALFGAETTVLAGATTQIPVFFLPNGSAPWQVPAAVAEIMNSSIANGSAATLIAAAPAGLDTYLFWCTLLGNATSLFYTLKGHTSGTVIGVGLTGATTAGTGPQLVKDFHGAKMGDLTGVAGEAVDLFNNGGAPVNFFGTLDYRYA